MAADGKTPPTHPQGGGAGTLCVHVVSLCADTKTMTCRPCLDTYIHTYKQTINQYKQIVIIHKSIETYSYTFTWLQMVRPPQPTHRGGAGTLCVHVVSLCADTKTMTCRPCLDTYIHTYKQTINQYKQIVLIHKSIETYSYTFTWLQMVRPPQPTHRGGAGTLCVHVVSLCADTKTMTCRPCLDTYIHTYKQTINQYKQIVLIHKSIETYSYTFTWLQMVRPPQPTHRGGAGTLCVHVVSLCADTKTMTCRPCLDTYIHTYKQTINQYKQIVIIHKSIETYSYTFTWLQMVRPPQPTHQGGAGTLCVHVVSLCGDTKTMTCRPCLDTYIHTYKQTINQYKQIVIIHKSIETYSYTFTWLQMVRPPQPTHRGGAGTLCVHVVSLCADTKTMTCRPCLDTYIHTYKQTINQYKQIVLIHKSIETYSYTFTWLQMVRPPQPTHRGGAGTLCVHVVSLCADTKTMTCRPCWDTHILTYQQTDRQTHRHTYINQYKHIVIPIDGCICVTYPPFGGGGWGGTRGAWIIYDYVCVRVHILEYHGCVFLIWTMRFCL